MKMSEAFKKIDAERDAMVKRKGVETLKVIAKDLSSVCYYGINQAGKPFFTGFSGRKLKPSRNFWYFKIEQRNEAMKEFMEGCAMMHERRKPKERGLSVGDVLVSTWGYEQTNVDFYKVLELKGKSSVVIAEISQERDYTGAMTGTAIPLPNKIIGANITCRADGTFVKVNSRQRAHKMEPTKNAAGELVYSSVCWTAYA